MKLQTGIDRDIDDEIYDEIDIEYQNHIKKYMEYISIVLANPLYTDACNKMTKKQVKLLDKVMYDGDKKTKQEQYKLYRDGVELNHCDSDRVTLQSETRNIILMP